MNDEYYEALAKDYVTSVTVLHFTRFTAYQPLNLKGLCCSKLRRNAFWHLRFGPSMACKCRSSLGVNRAVPIDHFSSFTFLSLSVEEQQKRQGEQLDSECSPFQGATINISEAKQ